MARALERDVWVVDRRDRPIGACRGGRAVGGGHRCDLTGPEPGVDHDRDPLLGEPRCRVSRDLLVQRQRLADDVTSPDHDNFFAGKPDPVAAEQFDHPVWGARVVPRHPGGHQPDRYGWSGSVTRIVDVNGSPTIALTRETRLTTVLSLDVAGSQIRGIHIVVNPDKLRHLPAAAVHRRDQPNGTS